MLSLRIAVVVCVAIFGISNPKSMAQQPKPDKPAPDLANVAYGPHPRNVVDVWKAKSATPTPLVLFIHGGGFRNGDKTNLTPELLAGCLANGMSVMAINYRLSPEVHYPAHYQDISRALQFARSKASEWNLDPKRVGSTGGSAGGCASLWLAFHDDLADPASADPVARQSTRLTCAAVTSAQTTLDRTVIRKLIGPRAPEHASSPGFVGVPEDQLNSPKTLAIFVEASPITYLTADDPLVYLWYNDPRRPLPADAKPGQGMHHPNFGTYLKERMDPLKIECVLRHKDDGAVADKEIVEFFVKHLKPATK